MKTYEVIVERVLTFRAKVQVEAESEDDAHEQVESEYEDLAIDEGDYELVHSSTSIISTTEQ